jgi:hypothetical protein
MVSLRFFFFSQPKFPAGDYGFYSICRGYVRGISNLIAFHRADQCPDAPDGLKIVPVQERFA